MKKILTLILLIVTITACEDQLNIENPNQATAESFWKNENDAIAGVNAVYSTLHRGSISRWMPFYYIIRSDEGKSTSPATDIVNNMDQFLVTDYNYGNAYGIWHDLYVGIFRANQVLDNVPNIDMNETTKSKSDRRSEVSSRTVLLQSSFAMGKCSVDAESFYTNRQT